jgi:hypothetical protein
MKSCGGLRPSFSAHVRWCEHGAPVWIRGTRHRIEGQTCGIPAIGAGIEQKALIVLISSTRVFDSEHSNFNYGRSILTRIDSMN